MHTIFLVEDDEKLNQYIREYLEKYQYQVITVKNFHEIEKEFELAHPDLVLLDINLPYYDGFYYCRLFRKESKVPIIIISARTTEAEQVMGIEFGADDYLTKPISLQILMAKISALIRRTKGEYIHNQTSSISIKGLVLEESTFKMIYQDNEIELTKKEFILLKHLMENHKKIVKRETLLTLLWDDENFVDDNTLTVNVTRVKNKLIELGFIGIIKTKRGVGYSLEM